MRGTLGSTPPSLVIDLRGGDKGSDQIAAKMHAKQSCAQAGRLQVLADKFNRLSDL